MYGKNQVSKDINKKTFGAPGTRTQADSIDYKQSDVLRRFVTEEGKIRPRRQTGTCARHQRELAVAIKRARHIALLPFTGRAFNEER